MKLKKSFLLLVPLILLVVVSCSIPNKQKNENNTSTSESVNTMAKPEVATTSKESKLKSSLVCFVNNKFMGIDQIPVEVDSKTYYGCCPDCVVKIKQNLNDVRFALDPLTETKVDKALAYIVLDPKGNGNQDVLYFETEQNHLNYINN
jgi:hypothetical protein